MGVLDGFLRGGGKFLKWDDVGRGTVVAGRVTSVEVKQATEYKTDKPAFWDDGSPKMRALIGLATGLRDPEDPEDTGDRTLAINLWSGQRNALRDACKAAGVDEPSVGDHMEAVWTSGAGNADSPRVFAYRITKGSGLAAAVAAPAADPWAAPADPFAGMPGNPPAAVPAPAPAAPVAAPPAPAAQTPVEMARSLLAAGVPHETVAATTGLSREIVAALANVA